jgi:cardiolipin synthase
VKPVWRDGNRVRLLENGEQFFPRVFEAIGAARREILIETFILFEDQVGRELQQALIAAARRGVHIELTVDGYGSPDLAGSRFSDALTAAGVRLHVFDPRPRIFGFRTNIFRRLHRKIVVIDGRCAFVGGLNFAEDHLLEHGPEAKQDYAVEIEGPLVADIQRTAAAAVAPPGHWWQRRAEPAPATEPAPAGKATAIFVTRDNEHLRDEIERHYREAIRRAEREVIIANAYFFPGYRLLRELRDAARRGVRVRLILQGNPDMPIVRWVGVTLYDFLLQGGVKIHEYCERPLHAKVAVIDEEWATVGSTNLDPLSLSLNLEANVVLRDREFARKLRQRLMQLVTERCEEIGPEQAPKRTLWRQLLSFLAFHVARRFPAWAGWLPGHKRPALAVTVPPANEAETAPKKEAA